jgi:hypothetical protein
MTAMGVERFVVTLVDAKRGEQEERRWNKAEVINSMAWLKRMNARGYDVWVRPDSEHGLVLLGGLKKDDLRTLRERGFAPAVVVETARDQYQAWVKLSQQPLGDPLRGQAMAGLVQGLGRHGAKAIGRADGRLAGFTNQQVQLGDGRHPYVLVGGIRRDSGTGGIRLSCKIRAAAREGQVCAARSRAWSAAWPSTIKNETSS